MAPYIWQPQYLHLTVNKKINTQKPKTRMYGMPLAPISINNVTGIIYIPI
jgi:hypothetical protein